jgi:hypothetical protein
MFKAIWEYIIAMGASWVSLISGICSAIFLIIWVFTNFSNEQQSKYWSIAFILSYVISSFNIWYKDRPNLQIELQKLYVIKNTTNQGIVVTFEMELLNRKQENNLIRKYKLLVNSDGIKQEGRLLKSTYLIDNKSESNINVLSNYYSNVCSQNIPNKYEFGFLFDEGIAISDKNYVLTLTDSYNNNYTIKGRIPLDFFTKNQPVYLEEV